MTMTIPDGDLAEIVAVTREFATGELLPRALPLDLGEDGVLDACWKGLCDIGLDRALLAEDAGGVGLSLDGLLAVLEELAVGDGGIATLALLSNAALLVMDQEARDAVGPSARCALVPLPAPGTPGSAALSVERKKATGRIPFALGAAGVDALVVVGHLGGEHEELVLLEAGAAGLVAEADERQLGLRGAPAAVVTCAGTPVRPLADSDAARRARALVNAGVAAIARGIARRAEEIALDYAENRYQGGSMIIEYGAIQDMIARMTERRRAVACAGAFGSAALADDDAELLAQALAARTAATDAAAETTTDAVQVFGGMGYMHDTGAEKLMRDARYCQLFPQANWLAREQLVGLLRG